LPFGGSIIILGGKTVNEKSIAHPKYHLIVNKPNPEMTLVVFRETRMSHLLLWGNVYAQIIRNGIRNEHVTENHNSMNVIWQVGKGSRVYLRILLNNKISY